MFTVHPSPRKMTFTFPCSPTITRQDRFDFLESDEVESPFWKILEYILNDSLESVTDVASLINVLETISVILRGEALTNYAFLQYFLDTHLGDSKSKKSRNFFTVIWPGLVHLALELPSLFPDSCIPPFNAKSTSELILSRRQVACLVVHSFSARYPHINGRQSPLSTCRPGMPTILHWIGVLFRLT